MAKAVSLYEMATGKGRVIRQGEIVQVVMDGAGAFVCTAQDFMVAQKWAMSRTGSSNMVTDRGRFIEKIEVLISRPNSFVSTRGNSVPVQRLAKTMQQTGYDLKDWGVPIEVVKALTVQIEPLKKAPVEVQASTDEPAAEQAD